MLSSLELVRGKKLFGRQGEDERIRGNDCGLAESREQRRFVAELCRVAPRVFISTPNRWFPLEVHTRLPLVHWLPEPAAHRAYDLARKPWAKENHLLGPGDLERLFRGRARIVNLGMTLVAIV